MQYFFCTLSSTSGPRQTLSAYMHRMNVNERLKSYLAVSLFLNRLVLCLLPCFVGPSLILGSRRLLPLPTSSSSIFLFRPPRCARLPLSLAQTTHLSLPPHHPRVLLSWCLRLLLISLHSFKQFVIRFAYGSNKRERCVSFISACLYQC